MPIIQVLVRGALRELIRQGKAAFNDTISEQGSDLFSWFASRQERTKAHEPTRSATDSSAWQWAADKDGIDACRGGLYLRVYHRGDLICGMILVGGLIDRIILFDSDPLAPYQSIDDAKNDLIRRAGLVLQAQRRGAP